MKINLSILISPYVYILGSNNNYSLHLAEFSQRIYFLKLWLFTYKIYVDVVMERLFGSSPLFWEKKDLLEVLRRLEKIDKRQVNTHAHLYKSG